MVKIELEQNRTFDHFNIFEHRSKLNSLQSRVNWVKPFTFIIYFESHLSICPKSRQSQNDTNNMDHIIWTILKGVQIESAQDGHVHVLGHLNVSKNFSSFWWSLSFPDWLLSFLRRPGSNLQFESSPSVDVLAWIRWFDKIYPGKK